MWYLICIAYDLYDYIGYWKNAISYDAQEILNISAVEWTVVCTLIIIYNLHCTLRASLFALKYVGVESIEIIPLLVKNED